LWEGTYEFIKADTIKCFCKNNDTIYFTISPDEEYVRLNGTGNVYAKD